MNKKQLIVALGLVAYIIGGSIVVIFNFEAFIEILRFKINLFTPILTTVGIILIASIILIYLFRKKK